MRIAVLLLPLICVKHPSDTKSVIECSVSPKELPAQRICDFRSLGELFKSGLQLLKSSAVQVDTKGVAANGRCIKGEPVRRRKFQIAASEPGIEDLLELEHRHLVIGW